MTNAEAMKMGGLDFEVELAPIYVKLREYEVGKEHQPLPSPMINIDRPGPLCAQTFYSSRVQGNFATVRKDTQQVFGLVGSRYEPIQNTEAFEFFDSIIGEGHANYETVGALGNGERVFITAKLPSHLHVNNDTIDKYLLLTMAHDGTGAIIVMFTPIRVVCNNTLTLALTTGSKVSIRHTKNALDRLDEAKKILGIANKNFMTLEEYFNHINGFKVNDDDAKNFFQHTFNLLPQDDGKLSTRASNKLDKILEYYNIGVGQEEIIGTGYGVFNAVTGYLQNVEERSDAKQFSRTFIKGDELIRERAKDAIDLLMKPDGSEALKFLVTND